MKRIKPLAVYEETDVIAIAEGVQQPWYAFAYAVEAVQFYFENSTLTLDQNRLDHSIIARTHAQFIANTIADETRLSTHSFAAPELVFERLTRHEKLVLATYTSDRVDSESMLPAGMNSAEIYVL